MSVDYVNWKHFDKSENFREAALEFKETGRFCPYPPNSSTKSRYYRFWQEQRRRSLQGFNTNGDFISGYNYFYLNYSPIFKVTGEEDDEHAERVFDFPDFYDNDYYQFHYYDEAEKEGLNGVVLAARRKGKSFKGASMLNRNYFLIPGSKSYAVAYDKQYLTEDGLLTKTWEMMDFIDQHTAFSKKRQSKNQDLHKRASYKKIVKGLETEMGYKSEIIGMTLKDQIKKIRGKAGKLMIFEEAGAFPELLKAWNIASHSMRQGGFSIGLMLAFGTGGEESRDMMGLEELFYNSGYKVKLIPNKWDEGVKEDARCGFFVPNDIIYQGYIDENGNSLKEKAREKIMIDREFIKNNTKDPIYILRNIAETCLVPQEAILRVGGVFFPVNDLKKVLADLVTQPKGTLEEHIGKFDLDKEGKVSFNENTNDCIPIVDFPLKGDTMNKSGCVVIWEMPVVDETGQIPYGIYIAGLDPYDHDTSTTDSLGSIFIMNRLTERIVAEYTGRPVLAEELYENIRRLLLFYNAKVNYENNLKGIFNYFSQHNCTHLMCDTPKIIYDKLDDRSVLSRKKGTPGTLPVNNWARSLVKTWLLTPIEKDGGIMNMHKIKSVPLLKELIYWNKDDNFDRVSSLGMLMVLKEEFFRVPTSKTAVDEESDKWWRDRYKGKTRESIVRSQTNNLM